MKPDHLLSLQTPWRENENPIWIATTFALHRNIEQFLFPAKLTPEAEKQVVQLLSKHLLERPELLSPVVMEADLTTPLQKEFLYEHFLYPKSLVQAQQGGAFSLDDSGEFFAVVNIDDHLSLHLVDTKSNLEESFQRLVRIENGLGKGLAWAFSSRFGFLTADPYECGTAFEATAFLQLPALIHTGEIDPFLEAHEEEGLYVSGLQGTTDHLIGDIVLVKNYYTLGLSEEDILSTVRSFATKLLVAEKGLRVRLKGEESAEIKDRISRAYGVLVHSYQIDEQEALDCISLLKLGLDLGYLEGVSMQDLNALFFNSRRAHLLSHFEKEIKQEELSHQRASYIHTLLKKMSLKL